ncbi:hypothetical protein WMY93_034012 [Mugilogobius chulae]|uniref:Ig-like domain-containing protein n=1 Tax=Mugilogobius chulae TaxID=88201 RepID=A0AAW0MIG3_9GOBI
MPLAPPLYNCALGASGRLTRPDRTVLSDQSRENTGAAAFISVRNARCGVRACEGELSPPSLTVEPSVITETDSVTLHCHPPDPTSVTLCYFFNEKGLGETSSSCQVTVRGSDLLKSQTPPAEVTVQCYYKTRGKQDNSPYSNKQTVTIQRLPPPDVTVEPSVITETDSVTLHCHTPDYVSVSLCYFSGINGLYRSSSSCQMTVRGSDLLKSQSPSAKVPVQCFYKTRGTDSPYSSTQTVIIQSSRPEVVEVKVQMDLAEIVCSLPQSAKSASCFLYFGESLHSISKALSGRMDKHKQTVLQIFHLFGRFAKIFRFCEVKEISCDYSLENGHKSSRSDGYDMRAFIKTTPVPQTHVTTAVWNQRRRQTQVM